MDRLACVDVPALPLQVLLREHPEWRGLPVAVVTEDRPQATVLWANDEARASGVRAGQRYAAALSLARGLRAGTVSQAAIRRAVDLLVARLSRFSPGVEPSMDEPGLFWLDVRGFARLYRTTGAWAQALRDDLVGVGFEARIAVGFTRFGTYAAARAGLDFRSFRTAAEEVAAARGVALACLDLPFEAWDGLDRLGVRTVGDLLRLPARAVLGRFGQEVYRLHRRASGEEREPLRPRPVEEPLCHEEELDTPDDDLDRLAFRIKRLLDPLLAALAARRLALASVEVRLTLDDLTCPERPVVTWTLRPAEPTLDAGLVLSLVWLRLEAADLPAGVTALAVRVEGAAATVEQLRLFQQTRRDLAAAGRAFARLRARFGDGAVVRATLRDAHLPEAGFAWEPLQALAPPAPRDVGERTMVRRIVDRPREIPVRTRPSRSPLPGRLRGVGRVTRWTGPFEVSGGWWRREVRREYWFAETDAGEVLWVFRDGARDRWFLQGWVE